MIPEMQKPTPPSLTPPPDTNTANWMREKWNQAKSTPSSSTSAVTSRAQKPAAIAPPPDSSSVGWMQDAWNNLKSKASSAMTSTTQEDDHGGGADKTEAAKPKRDASPQSQNSNRNYVVPKGGAAAAPGRGNSDATPQLDHIQHPKTYTPSYYTKRPEDIEAENSKTPPLQHYRPPTTYTPSSYYRQQPPAEEKQSSLEHFPDRSKTTYVPSHYYQHAYGNNREVEEATPRRGASPEKAPSSNSASSTQQLQPQQQKPNSSYFTNGPRFSHTEPAIPYYKM